MEKILPPEWAKQQFVQLTWPHEDTDWAYMLDEVNACFVEIARSIIRFEDLLVVCKDEAAVRKLLGDADLSGVRFVELPSDDTWARDHGGITVLEAGKRVIYDFGFNGWGKKFEAASDNRITGSLFRGGFFGSDAAYRDCLNFILEGGSLESDGEGALLTTSRCLLSDNRNGLSRVEIEDKLKDFFGLSRVLWLDHGFLAGDDTDSHIDTLARLCSPDTIAYVKCFDREDEHYDALSAMENELLAMRTSGGEPYRLIPLPMADAVYEDNERLPATYANFLIMNGAVLVPVYNSPKDREALSQMAKAFPDREIVGVDCTPLIKQHGSLHCVTMQYV